MAPDRNAAGSGRRGRRGSRRGGAEAESKPQGGTEAQAKDVCLRMLSDRARSRAELADKLAAKGFTPEIAERALDRLAEVGLIDDAAFAEQWVHSRHTFSGKGKKVLAQELRRKGVDPEDAAPALDAISGDDERARAVDLVRQKLRTLPSNLDRDRATRRLVGMLARRGYNPSTAYSVVTAELATADLPDPPRHDPSTGGRSGLQRQPPAPSIGDEELVAAATATTADSGQAIDDLAATLVRRKLRTIPRDLDRDKKIRRLVSVLARRGYGSCQAYAIVKAELAAVEGE